MKYDYINELGQLSIDLRLSLLFYLRLGVNNVIKNIEDRLYIKIRLN
jgi:hypothetical protein